jgi:CBS domain-containing protein
MRAIGEVCQREVVVATPDTTVTAAAKLMRRKHVGSIVIVDRVTDRRPKPLGIVTDRDLVLGVTALELDPDTTTLGDIMPPDLVTAHATDDAFEVMQLMRMKGIRRVPLVSQDGRLIGLVSFDDLLEAVTDELSTLTKAVGREQARESATRR